MTVRKYSRIQEKGQITPQKVVSINELGDISALLKEAGLTIEDLMESGREERGWILQERYGYDDSQIRE